MPPLVRTNPAANVGGQSATLKGTVTPRGKTTEFFFAYGTTKAYGQRTPTQTVGAGNGAQQVSQTVGGLRVGTQYHFRIVATNPDGTSSGGDRTFRTRPPDPNALLLTEQPNPLLFGHSAALSGQLLGPNNAGVGVTLMARPASQPTGPFSVAAGPIPTDANGGYGFFVLPGINTTYHAVAATARGTASVNLNVGVRLQRQARREPHAHPLRLGRHLLRDRVPRRRRRGLDPEAQQPQRPVRDRVLGRAGRGAAGQRAAQLQVRAPDPSAQLRQLPGRRARDDGPQRGLQRARQRARVLTRIRCAAVPQPPITPELARRTLPGSFPGDLGIELVSIADDEVHGRLEVDRRHLHPGGYVHGGVWVAFADTVAAWGTFRHLREGQDFTTAELKANVFAAGRDGDTLTAVGVPLHVGRRTQTWEVKVYKGEKLAALFVCTQIVLHA